MLQRGAVGLGRLPIAPCSVLLYSSPSLPCRNLPTPSLPCPVRANLRCESREGQAAEGQQKGRATQQVRAFWEDSPYSSYV